MFRPTAVVMMASAFALPATAAEPTAAESFAALQKEWEDGRNAHMQALDKAKMEAERVTIRAKVPDAGAFAARFLKLAETHPNTDEELAALTWAALCAPKSEAGKTATERLPKRIDAVKTLAPLRRAVQVRAGHWEAERALAPAVLAKAKELPDDPKAASILTWVCAAHWSDPADQPSAAFTAAADLIADRYADSKDITNFGVVLGRGYLAYAGEFEGHLKKVLKKNTKPAVVESCRFALASIALAGGEKRQDEAEKLFREFVAEFEKKEDRSGLCDTLIAEAKQQADLIKRCGLGKPAQKTKGDDLDGKPVNLADHKGKVVLLVFWASWCGPCMADVPHEKELAEKFKDRPFVILGVSGDTDKDEALKAVKRAGIPWRSIWGGEKWPGGPHAEAWCVGGWPTVFVIDHTGVIRHNTLRGKALDEPLEALVKAAEKAVEEKK